MMAKKRKKSRTISKRRPRKAGAKAPRSAKTGPRAGSKRGNGGFGESLLRSETDSFLVVGLGASAGGLEAVRTLLAALPADTGIAFVLIQHLDPDHKSMLVELLTRDTAMKVIQAADGIAIERNCLYVIPPHAYLSVHSGSFSLSEPRARHGARMPFDFFLQSLAREYGERAACVVLSGTGADGSIGLKAIREKGGLVIAQDPEEAAYGGMPQSAIATLAVDLVLSAAGIPTALIRFAHHPLVTANLHTSPDEAPTKSLSTLIDLLHSKASHDFSHYKTATLLRRIRRRMATAGIPEIEDYIKVLRKDGRELESLAKDLLIHVTSFFRDPTVYETLAKTVIPDLVRQHPGDQPIRVWVPGCSTGEEAYSLAMLFLEEFAVAKRSLRLQLFASDVSADAVAFGRNGIYPDSIKADVSAARLARFFTHGNEGYQVSRDLRDSIVFTVQDLLTDPPFSHLDFISCRNLLIYLQPDEQEKVLLLFHFALEAGGLLLLGSSETIGKLADHFEPISNPLRIFRRVGGNPRRDRAIVPSSFERARSLWPRVSGQVELKRPGLADFARRLLLETYVPATALVNRKYQGLYLSGPIDRYLRVAAGEPSRDLPTMLRDGLASKFRAAIRQAEQNQDIATVRGARIKRNGDTVAVDISARPVLHDGEQLFLVNFADDHDQKSTRPITPPGEISHVDQIEHELDITRKELETTISELEASNQELMSLNEEAVSMNEEFQSTNEELETSREELQSLNEELTTVNSQLQESLERERRSSSDFQNVLDSSEITTIFLDRDLKIRFFTPAAAPLFNLIATDIGRPLPNLAIQFTGIDLPTESRAVLASLKPIKREVRAASGAPHLCSVSPYRSQADRIEGVVINLVDISELKAGEAKLRLARVYTETIVNTIHEPLVVLDRELRVVSASESFYHFFGATPEDTLGRLLPETDAHHLDTAALRTFLNLVKSSNYNTENYEIEVDLPPLGRRALLVTAAQIRGKNVDDEDILISFNDITDFKHATEQLAAKQAAELANLAKSRFLAAASHDLRQPLQTLALLQGALKQQIKDEKVLILVAKAELALETMSDTLNALLDINQLESGTVRPQLVEFPIGELLDALRSEFTEQASGKGLRWRVVSSRWTVTSDRRFLTEMVRNLVTNAFRYTDKGGVLLGCRRHADKLRIEVWDTGMGISEDEIPRIFGEYHQASGHHQRGGLGLGLAIVQRLGELLGHAVQVRSEVGKGSVFYVETPCVTAVSKPSPAESRDVAAASTGTLLVVEDELSVRESLELLLEREGHAVSAVASGESALALVVSETMRPDLVITDYDLPGGMSGVQTAAALRSALGRKIPIVILTGDIRTSVQRSIIEQGCVGLSKPVMAEDLSRVIQEQLVRSRSMQLDSAVAPPVEPRLSTSGPTIFVVDDDRHARDALRSLLAAAGYQVETYTDAKAFLGAYRPDVRGCLVTDVRMPGMNGFELVARLAAVGSGLPTIVITGQGDIAMAVQAIKAGAVDFIEKPTNPDMLLASVKRALSQAASPTEITSLQRAAAMRIAGLTRREREVMALVVAGQANKEIAARLGINQRTIESHRAAVMKKMNASSLSELVRLELAGRGSTASRAKSDP